MIICPGCNGHGFIENHQGRDVCSKCGAFGFIKKVDESKENTEVEREVY